MADYSPQSGKRAFPHRIRLFLEGPWITYGRENEDTVIDEMTAWLDQPEMAGKYNFHPRKYDREKRLWVSVFFFTEAATALAFRLRFG